MRPGLLRAATRFTNSRHEAEDLVQTALARCWERRGLFRDETNLDAWMKKVLRNLAIDEARRGFKLCLGGDDTLGVPAPDPVAPVPWENIDVTQVREAAGRCSPLLHSAFVMFYFEGLSLNQIGERCRVSPRTAGTRIHRARKKVREQLAPLLVPDAG